MTGPLPEKGQYMQNRIIGVMAIAMLLIVGLIAPATASHISEPDGTLAWNGSKGLDSEGCSIEDEGDPRNQYVETGWIHWVFVTGGNDDVTDSQATINGTVYDSADKGSNTHHFYTPYFDPSNLSAEVAYTGETGNSPSFHISDFCAGEEEEEETPDPATPSSGLSAVCDSPETLTLDAATGVEYEVTIDGSTETVASGVYEGPKTVVVKAVALEGYKLTEELDETFELSAAVACPPPDNGNGNGDNGNGETTWICSDGEVIELAPGEDGTYDTREEAEADPRCAPETNTLIADVEYWCETEDTWGFEATIENIGERDDKSAELRIHQTNEVVDSVTLSAGETGTIERDGLPAVGPHWDLSLEQAPGTFEHKAEIASGNVDFSDCVEEEPVTEEEPEEEPLVEVQRTAETLPVTGGNPALLALLAAILMGGGTGTLALGRRR